MKIQGSLYEHLALVTSSPGWVFHSLQVTAVVQYPQVVGLEPIEWRCHPEYCIGKPISGSQQIESVG